MGRNYVERSGNWSPFSLMKAFVVNGHSVLVETLNPWRPLEQQRWSSDNNIKIDLTGLYYEYLYYNNVCHSLYYFASQAHTHTRARNTCGSYFLTSTPYCIWLCIQRSPSSLLFRTRHFRDWILPPSSCVTYQDPSGYKDQLCLFGPSKEALFRTET